MGVRVHRVRPAKSGLVQRVQRVVVGGCAASMDKTFTTALTGEGKTSKTPLGAKEMHPFWYLRYHLPPGGGTLLSVQLLNS